MFERRLKIFLIVLGAGVGLLMLRAMQVQVIRHADYVVQAAKIMKSADLMEAPRGIIFDRTGAHKLAIDEPCIDACIDYRAVEDPPDEAWVKSQALARLKGRWGSDAYAESSTPQKRAALAAAIEAVKSDIHMMWLRLAQISSQTPQQIDQARQAIVRRVWMRQHWVWYRRYQQAMEKREVPVDATGWRRFLADSGYEKPQFDSFGNVTVTDQLQSHVILHAVDTDTQNALGKDIDKLPGLVLRPGTHRYYPYGDVACHLLGGLGHVDRDDIAQDPEAGNELRHYLPNDLKGSSGAEALCEPALRGTRGRIVHVAGEIVDASNVEPIAGKNVRLSIDIDLQQQIQASFASARIRDSQGKIIEEAVLHGAAVVLDVASGRVRALVSYPTYDLNSLEDHYAALRDDDVNEPLLNRATLAQREPGSTMKPITGLAGIGSGLVKVDEGIECTGYLQLGGRQYSMGRCWVASKFSKVLKSVAHHPVPPSAPHPTGFLTLTDALERSCNVYFETVADRLGIERLSDWEMRFGLGRPTGIGIAEAKGRVVGKYPGPAALRRATCWFAGIGQGYVAATPIQMANVAATIARGGIWVRPSLLDEGPNGLPDTRPGAFADVPQRVDLNLPADAVGAAWTGMFNVVNGKAGTGTGLIAGDDMLAALEVAGKTGTAQAAPLRVKKRDADGNVVVGADGKPVFEYLEPSTLEKPNPRAPWYRGSGAENHDLAHAWYIGFAPARHPQIAFAVMVEYGGSGGVAAAAIARDTLEACIQHHYLQVNTLAGR